MATIWVSKNGSNSNPGSSSGPLKTIQAAVDRATEGTEIRVKAGTYTENISIKKDGISLVSADGQYAAKIKAASQTKAAISGFGKEDIKIVDFDITGPSKANGIHFGMSSKNFTDLVNNLTIEGNKIHGSGLDGIKISQADNVKIVDNEITKSGEQGIDFVAVNDSKIAGNNLGDTRGPSALMVKGGSSNVTIDNNKVYDAKDVGISVGGWSDEHWMRPGTRHYEAQNLKVTNNVVWDTGKSAVLVSGAHNSLLANNILDSNKDYDAVVWLDRSTKHAPPIYTKNINIEDNTFLRSDWLQVNNGNNSGLKVSGNEIDNSKVKSAQKGAFGSSDSAQDAAVGEAATDTNSTDKVAASQLVEPKVETRVVDEKVRETAVTDDKSDDHAADHAMVAQAHSLEDKKINADGAPEVIAIDKNEMPAGYENSLLSKMPLLLNFDSNLLVYTPVREGNFEVQGQSDADNLLFFNLSEQTAHEAISSAMTRWQALEDAAPQVDTTAIDTTHRQDNHQTDAHANWLLG